MPFDEPGAPEVLTEVVGLGRLRASSDPTSIAEAEHVVVVIGTPIDEHLNPDLGAVDRRSRRSRATCATASSSCCAAPSIPASPRWWSGWSSGSGSTSTSPSVPSASPRARRWRSSCTLPQIVAGAVTAGARTRGASSSATSPHEIVELEPEEAELAKLFTNTWRYIKFAAANQLFMMANDFGLDYERIRAAVMHNYPRAADLPGAGFAAGPCLFKDTMQLAAFNNNNFGLGPGERDRSTRACRSTSSPASSSASTSRA